MDTDTSTLEIPQQNTKYCQHSALKKWIFLTLTLLSVGCNQDTQTNSDINDGSSLAIEVIDDNLIIGEHVTLQVTLIRPSGERSDISNMATLQSGNPSVIQKQDDGKLMAVDTGSAELHASYRGLSATVSVSVQPFIAKSLFIDTPQIHLLPSNSVQVNVFAYLNNHTTRQIRNIEWESDNTNIATIKTDGTVTAKRSGIARFQAHLANYTAELIVDVPDDENLSGARLTLDSTNINLPQEGTMFVRSYLELNSGAVIDTTDITQWTAEDTELLHFDTDGQRAQIIPDNVGATEITANVDVGKHAFSTLQPVTISPGKLKDVLISAKATTSDLGVQSIPSLPAGASTTLTATAYFDSGKTMDFTRAVQWKTDDDNTIQLVSDGENVGTVVGLAPGTAKITASLNGTVAETDFQVSNTQVKTIRIATDIPATMLKGLPWQYSAIAEFDDGTEADISQQAAWFSSDSDIASVNTFQENPGFVVPLRSGETDIEIQFAGISAKRSITVTDAYITGIELTPNDNLQLNLGEVTNIEAHANLSDESTLNITKAVNWRSSAPAIISVQSVYNDHPGEVEAKAPGNASISVFMNYIGSKNLPVTVAFGDVISVSISPSSAIIPLGAEFKFEAIAELKSGNKQDVSTETEWLSDDPDTLQVLGEGMTKAINLGNTNIHANYHGFVDSKDAQVTDAAVEKIEVSGTLELQAGGSEKISDYLTAKAIFTDGSFVDLDDPQWTASDPMSLAVMDGDIALGISPGETEIAVTYNTVTEYIPITIDEPLQPDIQIKTIEEIEKDRHLVTFETQVLLDRDTLFVQWASNHDKPWLVNGRLEKISPHSFNQYHLVRSPETGSSAMPKNGMSIDILPNCSRKFIVKDVNPHEDGGNRVKFNMYTADDSRWFRAGAINFDITWERDGKFYFGHINSGWSLAELYLQEGQPAPAEDSVILATFKEDKIGNLCSF
ncbi:Uncharacterised protein [BD1-7 clade bacterium]|uniref:BIG2 domain-containing protein n=1 Tax=BD1-7 clade bacterium TaxID=2029982 RepID=A0A5S9NU03_9GAMM|nr:Uncharacterised protein [BD1-7 clade bacterium]CAA0094190.1 Uncharacterised protein [BD1-7 clade bacterium]